MLEMERTSLAGLVLLRTKAFQDERGVFVKTFHEDIFRPLGDEFKIRESYYSISKKNVLRGMHYQRPPYDHAKIVFVLQGVIRDVVLDMREGSSTFGETYESLLSSENKKGVFIPSGFAHGFYVTSEQALVMYHVSSVYKPEADDGIRWDSFKHAWQISDPIMSERDLALPCWCDTENPFGKGI